MIDARPPISFLLSSVRRRWRAVTAMRVGSLGAASAGLVLACALTAEVWLRPESFALVLLWSAAVAGAAACLGWALWSMRAAPRDGQVARFIEECCPELEDVLATVTTPSASHDAAMLGIVERDANERARAIDPDRIISRRLLRRCALRQTSAILALGLVVGLSLHPIGQAARVLSFYLFPDRVALEVTPGNV